MSECRTAEGRPKIRYGTRADAKAAAKRWPGDDQRPYRCSRCGWFHLGHYPATGKARAHLRSRHRRATG